MYVDAVNTVLEAVGAGGPTSLEPLAGGTYNTVTRVAFGDGRDWVVKIPPAHTAGLSYEQHLLVNEVTFYESATGAGDTIPQVVHSALAPEAPGGAYVVMTACPGRPWSAVAGELTADETRALRTEFGSIVGRLHGVTGPAGFGYPGRSLGPLSPTWREAFTAMTDAVLADAERYGAGLPRPSDRIREVLAGAADVLDEVTRPALVHFDLWQGNVLVTGGPGARRIGGIVDGERMFWGDPVADLVSTSLFGDPEGDEDFLAGYAAATGTPLVFTPSIRRRLDLYRSYLYLIMLTETVPRGYGPEALARTWETVAPRLVTALDGL
ncbi:MULTISPECIES: phosphotransferase family protein [Streptomyces]|uniref:Aminoglycoside phosphotransferase family protein n=1 Tax=Streptomyces glycanivorans TaxID=3033808 RepID=A0ABY9JBJ9_9ACTN|nr:MULTISPECIES: aminoglycoside phosphotransferase family protein [unclassified Streptomyces]TXS16826.1 aminoglycoside phosphotransferase family protein [Streptomyces sp. wa22]WLQ65055.1 aminoglycoside phosphotransferase family protein [Streptomyces sp. Alt3]WSQ78437.1 aminoglycoside phosphotransferase family protein [Streptomyces sp. NBC_01213]WSR49174.1 aminoglycoside phosphotransferase family protein [Streptomyces sp. NBC_01201]